jgi:hypothetical protein
MYPRVLISNSHDHRHELYNDNHMDYHYAIYRMSHNPHNNGIQRTDIPAVVLVILFLIYYLVVCL